VLHRSGQDHGHLHARADSPSTHHISAVGSVREVPAGDNPAGPIPGDAGRSEAVGAELSPRAVSPVSLEGRPVVRARGGAPRALGHFAGSLDPLPWP